MTHSNHLDGSQNNSPAVIDAIKKIKMNKISLKVTDQDKAFANDERIEEEKIIKEAEKLAKIEQ